MRVSICLWLYFWHQEQTVAHSGVLGNFCINEYVALFAEDLFHARFLAGPWGSEAEGEWSLPSVPGFLFVLNKNTICLLSCVLLPQPAALDPF